MPKNHFIKIRVDRREKDMLQANADRCGYATISAFLRHAGLQYGIKTEMVLSEIRNGVKKLLEEQDGRKTA